MRSNIVLIGMPGAGKSTVGVILAKRFELYTKYADITVTCAGLTQEKVCEKIIERIETSSPAAAQKPGEAIRHVQRTVHLTGPERALTPIVQKTLGIRMDEIKRAL